MRVVGLWRWVICLVPAFVLFTAMPALAQDDILDEIEAELKKEAEQKKAQAKADKNKEKSQASYQAAIRKGDALMRAKKYDDAIDAYTEAKKWGPMEPYPDQQLEKARTAKKEEAEAAKAAEIDAQYKTIISKADAYFNGKKYQEAISQYQEAAKVKGDEAYPKDQITEAKKLIAKQEEEKKRAAEEAALNKKFDEAMAAGDAAIKSKDFDVAIAKYTEASKLKPNEAEPKSRVATAEKMKADETARLEQEKLQKQYDALITEADNLLKSSQFDQAKAKYEAASKVLPQESYPKTKMKECDDSKLAAEQAALRAQYDALIKEGNDLLKAENFDGAVAKFEEAGKVMPQESQPKELIKQAQNLKTNKEQQAIQERFNTVLLEAEKLIQEEKFDEGIAKLKEANKILPTENKTTELIAEAEKMKQAKADQIIKDQYEAKLKEGEDLLRNNEFDQAISKFEEAKTILKTDNRADNLIEQAKGLKEDQAQQAKLAEFNEVIKSGEELLKENRFDEAIAKFEAAQQIIPTDSKPKTLIQQANDLRKAREDELAKQEFDEYIKTGDQALEAKNYEEALASFKGAGAAYPAGQNTVDARIAKVNAAKKEAEDLAKAEAEAKAKKDQFDKLVAEAEQAKSSGDLEGAKEAIGQALLLFPNDSEAQGKQKEIDQLLLKAEEERQAKLAAEAAAKEQAEKEAKVADYIAQAEASKNKNEFTQAKNYLSSALTVIPDHPEALAKQKEIESAQKAYEEKMAAEAAAKEQAEKEAKVSDFLAQAESAKNANEFSQAENYISSALNVIPDHPEALKKQTEIKEAKSAYEEKLAQDQAAKEAAEKAAAEKKAKIDGLNAQGASLLAAKKYDEAIAAYDEVLSIDASDPTATQKKSEAIAAKSKAEQDALAAAAEAEKEAAEQAKQEQIATLLSQAQGQFDSKQYDQAKATYQQVLGIDANESTAKQKIAEIDRAVAAEEQEKLAQEKAAQDKLAAEALAKEKAEREAQIQSLSAEARSLEDNGDLNGAKAKWNALLAIDAGNSDASSGIARIDSKIQAAKDAEALAAKEEADRLAKEAQAKAAADRQAQIESLSSEAQRLEDGQDYSGALSKWKEVLAIDASNSTAGAAVSRIELKLKEEQEALAKAEEAERLKREEEARKAAAAKKQQDEAARKAKIESLTAEATAAENSGNLGQAIESWNAVLSIDAGSAAATAAVARLKKKQDKIKADQMAADEAARKAQEAEAAKQAEQEKKNLIASYLQIGDQILADKQYDRALENYQKAKDLDPSNPEITGRISRAQELKSNEEDRISRLEADERKNEIAVLLTDAKLLSIKRKYKEAGDKYNKVLTYESNNQQAKEGLASIQKYLDQIAEKEAAEAERLRVEAENQKKIEAILDEGSDLFAGGQYDEAIAKYKEGLEIDPLNAELKSFIRNSNQAKARAEQYRIAKLHNRPKPKPEGFKTENLTQTTARTDKTAFQNELGKAYPEGVTEEKLKKPRKDITRRVVVKEGNGTEFFKVRHDWGGVYYFKNGESITPYLWQYGTRSPDQITN